MGLKVTDRYHYPPPDAAWLAQKMENMIEIDLPIIYGQNVRDWWVKPNEPLNPKGLLEAWSGSNAESDANGTAIRLFKWTWENPLQDLEIRSIDFVSDKARSAPFLLAITAE